MSATTTPATSGGLLNSLGSFVGSIFDRAPAVITALNQPKAAEAAAKAQAAALAAQQQQTNGNRMSWSTMGTPAKVGIVVGGLLVVGIILKLVFGKK